MEEPPLGPPGPADPHEVRRPAPGARFYQEDLGKAAEDFIGKYDQLRPLAMSRAAELGGARKAADALLEVMRPWVARVAASAAAEGFDGRQYGKTPAIVDDLIADAESLIAVVTKANQDKPGALPFAEELLAGIQPALETARKEWVEGQDLRDAYQELSEQSRESGQRFAELLVGFRRSLAGVLGRRHPAYQALRSAKIERDVLEPGEEKMLPPELVPAPGDGVEQEKMSA